MRVRTVDLNIRFGKSQSNLLLYKNIFYNIIYEEIGREYSMFLKYIQILVFDFYLIKRILYSLLPLCSFYRRKDKEDFMKIKHCNCIFSFIR